MNETGSEKNEEKERGGAGKGKEVPFALFLPLPLLFLVFSLSHFLSAPIPVEALGFRGCPRGTSLCSWAGESTLMAPLFAQVYKWVP